VGPRPQWLLGPPRARPLTAVQLPRAAELPVAHAELEHCQRRVERRLEVGAEQMARTHDHGNGHRNTHKLPCALQVI